MLSIRAAGDTDEIVANAQQGFALDLYIGLEKKVKVFHHGTGERILDGDDRGTDLGALDQLEKPLQKTHREQWLPAVPSVMRLGG